MRQQKSPIFAVIRLAMLVILSLMSACKSEVGNRDLVTPVEAKQKNVLFILVDDLGWMDLGCYGSSFYETPNIDRLAARSTRFTQAYTPNPVCSPTRAAILTGKYPSRVGITDWIPGDDPKDRALLGPQDLNQLPLEEVTLAEALKSAGYKTFFAGKWHLGNEGYFPEDQGFDINKGGHHMGQPPGGYYSPYNNPKLSDGPEGEYLTDRLANESIAFLEANKDNPFLLYLSFYTVHTPIQASKRHVAKFQEKKRQLTDSLPNLMQDGNGYTVQNQYNADYASMVYALDENVGRVLDKLNALGLTDNTLIVFTSDNGGLTTLEYENWVAPTSVKPLRAGKGWMYEGGIRVPLLISRPGQTAGVIAQDPVMSIDLFPTLLQELQIENTNAQSIDGQSLTSVLDGVSKGSERTLFWHYPHYHASGWRPGSGVRVGDWKLIYFYEDDAYELYNITTDPGEQYDVKSKYPEIVQKLQDRLQHMIAETSSEVPKFNVGILK
ncbi:MAG: hypothetical protein RLZZ241_2146 [Bacteroidota bacterium]|jgi:arylsulfatase A-like enzyme